MNIEKFTQKSIEAIREAQSCAIRNQNMQIDQQHLLYALLNQEDGAAAQILKKAKIDVKRMATACDREIQRIPRVSGPGREMDRVYVSQSVDAALTEAEQQAEYMKDEYVSVEHILLGIIERPNGAIRNIFNESGLTKEAFLE
ncbi:MAG: type VI secretion system ATPase TssH, partial [Clostridia bacterium]|nr:type VI secretion system ATPase TssH [Clostridia bacterium]